MIRDGDLWELSEWGDEENLWYRTMEEREPFDPEGDYWSIHTITEEIKTWN